MTERLTTFSRDGLTFDVRDAGPLDGPAVVLLHGFPQLSDSWDQVAPILHAAGLRTVAMDQRGYSPGARPRGRRAYRSTELVADVEALVGAAGGGPVHLVGHDWGAAVAWGVAALRPQLARSLVAVSVPHPAAFLGSVLRSDQGLRSWYMALFQLPWLPERLAAGGRIFPRFLAELGMTEEMLARFHDQFLTGDRLTAALNWYRAIPFASPGDLRRKVGVPTTMVWSDRDAALGPASARMCGSWVDAPYQLRVLEGVGHWIPNEAPGQLADAILDRIGSVA
jgi:pimeloyl-ACP methyl ester carboxylesterase